MTPFDSVCFISARNLGDAVAHADFLRRLQLAGFASRWIVWTFSQAAFLFENLPNCKIVCSDFPIGSTGRSFLKGGFRSFLKAVHQLRKLKPNATLDIIGDYRERLACLLLGAPLNLSPEWETGHPFRHHIRVLPFKSGRPLTVPMTELNLYAAHDRMLRTLVPEASSKPGLPVRDSLREGQALNIGIHPSASAPFKLWPHAHWARLIDLLSERFPGSRFTLFGAPSERARLEHMAASIQPPHEIFTASLREFRQRLAETDLLVGLDSFSVHLAHSQGVPSVVLVGANDPRIFTPPSARAVTHPGRCEYQPCGGRPKCLATDFEFSCMTSIEPLEALAAVPVVLHQRAKNAR